MASLLANVTDIPLPPHPFYPPEANVVGYIANVWSVPTLLGLFAAGWVFILGTTHVLVNKINPYLSTGDSAAILWHVLTGTIHLFFEGYFSYFHATMPTRGDFFGQLWKEYSFSDSRYLTSDPFVLCMETTTAFLWGPICFIIVLMITYNHPLRHPLQALVATGQLYGLLLYYATSMFDLYYRGVSYSRPERYYFWMYFFLANFIWVVIPGNLLYNSIDASAKAFKALAREEKAQTGNGSLKKSL